MHQAPVTGRDLATKIAVVEVENPDWEPSKDGVGGIPRYDQRAKNVRESAIETLYARRHLSTSQKRAADKLREVWEAAGGKTASLDYTLDRVDGGKGDPITTRLIAAQELQRVRNLVGRRNYENLKKVCCEGMALDDLGQQKREKNTVADNLRADLDDMASMWGMQTRRRSVA